MTHTINPLSEELLYGSPEAPEIAGLEDALCERCDPPAKPEESDHDRREP